MPRHALTLVPGTRSTEPASGDERACGARYGRLNRPPRPGGLGRTDLAARLAACDSVLFPGQHGLLPLNPGSQTQSAQIVFQVFDCQSQLQNQVTLKANGTGYCSGMTIGNNGWCVVGGVTAPVFIPAADLSTGQTSLNQYITVKSVASGSLTGDYGCGPYLATQQGPPNSQPVPSCCVQPPQPPSSNCCGGSNGEGG
jgi:hypothetical protein